MTDPLLQVRRLSYHYPDGRQALSEVGFDLAGGERVALVGPNGAGKSTLLLHLNGILPGRGGYEHHHGADLTAHPHSHAAAPSVFVGGLALTDANLFAVRRRVGLLFQDPDDQLFCSTVAEDVAFGPRNLGCADTEIADRTRRALERVGLPDSADRPPHHLSFGERKRACLAGVLACEPDLLALDEPSANLDPRGRRMLIELLRGLPAALLLATHDLEMAVDLCPRTLVLDAGRLIADGPTVQVLADEDLLAEHGLEVPLSIRLGSREVR